MYVRYGDDMIWDLGGFMQINETPILADNGGHFYLSQVSGVNAEGDYNGKWHLVIRVSGFTEPVTVSDSHLRDKLLVNFGLRVAEWIPVAEGALTSVRLEAAQEQKVQLNHDTQVKLSKITGFKHVPHQSHGAVQYGGWDIYAIVQGHDKVFVHVDYRPELARLFPEESLLDEWREPTFEILAQTRIHAD
jgi:hypothetical protein